MYKKILKINIFVFVLIFTSILVAAQSDKDSIVKVYVDGILIQDYSVRFVLRKQDYYKLKLKANGHRLVANIPIEEYSHVDSLIVRVCSVAPKRKVYITSCVRYNERFSSTTCIICNGRTDYHSEIEIWHPISYRSSNR